MINSEQHLTAKKNKYKQMKKQLILTAIFTIFSLVNYAIKAQNKPNIVIIYADDMGYGDVNYQNPNSKIPTPNIDKLASEGMQFTDGHSSSGICSPSRFALLTGTYHWRRTHGIVETFGKPLFKDSDITLPQVLKDDGYRTACIGKWHLGWNWNILNKPTQEVMQWGKMRKYFLPSDIVWNEPVTGGPLDRGFDYYFGDGTISKPPFAWMENDRLLDIPTETFDINNSGFKLKEGENCFRPGPKHPDWNPYEVLPKVTQKTVDWIHQQDKNQPFFLYFALPSPHTPIVPTDEFDGTSEAGPYGDFMVQTDRTVGQVLKALKDKGFEDNTIVIFTSDNGPESEAWDRAENYDHYSMGNLRGLKRDVWEGGHHVPFIVKWPKKIKAGSFSDEVISQVDIMATLASITGIELSENTAPDSNDFTDVITGKKYNSPLREATIHNTYKSIWGVRKGDYLYINNSTGGHRTLPKSFKELTGYTDFNTKGILFNMVDDPEQRVNLYNKYPEKIIEMDSLIYTYRNSNNTVKTN
jgi:arylsulfatase A